MCVYGNNVGGTVSDVYACVHTCMYFPVRGCVHVGVYTDACACACGVFSIMRARVCVCECGLGGGGVGGLGSGGYQNTATVLVKLIN